VQLCGDAHLSNFGLFASPERRLLFDLNDFDETLPGPFEWDVKRMAASFTIAARNNGFAKMDTRAVTQASVRAYREAMASFADMGTLAIWYAHLSEDELVHAIRSAAAEASKPKKAAKAAKGAEKSVLKVTRKARTRDSLQALSKLGEVVDGRYRIVSQPPIVVPVRDLEATYGLSSAQAERNVHAQFRAYRAGLREDQRQLLERFELVDAARKVVGVGSVGTRAFIALLQGSRSAGSAVLAGQGGDYFGPGGPVAKKPPRPGRPAGGRWAADDAGRQRHLLGLDQGGGPHPSLLLAAVARHEGLGRGRNNGPGRARLLRWHLRVDPGPGPRPLRRPHRHHRLPGQQRPVRPVDHRLRPAVRRPERTGF
jgi:uncharacterized protein (DUF2252 family)